MASIPSTVALPQPLTTLATTGTRRTTLRAAAVSPRKHLTICMTSTDHQMVSRIAERFGMSLGAVVRNLLRGIPLPRSCSDRPSLGDATLSRELADMRLQLLRAMRVLALAGEWRGMVAGSPAVRMQRPHLAILALEREVQHCVTGLECVITALLTGPR